MSSFLHEHEMGYRNTTYNSQRKDAVKTAIIILSFTQKHRSKISQRKQNYSDNTLIKFIVTCVTTYQNKTNNNGTSV